MRILSAAAVAGALVIGLGGAAMANTAKIDMDNGNGRTVERTTHASMHQRMMDRRHAATMRNAHRRHLAMLRHRHHRGWRGYGYAAPMYGYGYGSSNGLGWASQSYNGNSTETPSMSGSMGVNQ